MVSAGLPRGVKPYDWALRQLRVARAHETTRGDSAVVVAVIDLGYRHHPDLDGHLWVNPDPDASDRHGWDCADDDASLEGGADSDYARGHHVFVAGEVAAVAPECPIMIVRVGYGRPDSWAKGIRYAVDRGARVLVMPHGYLPGRGDTPLFYQGTDFSYPTDNPEIRRVLDDAYTAGCLTFRGTCDNRGRRATFANSACDSVVAVGSTNRRDEPADICCDADHVEIGAPGGQRGSDDERDRVWGCGGDENTIPFTGGCMACGFAGGVAALAWSRFPDLSNEQLRMVLRNTARPAKGVTPDADGWEPRLGDGILDAAKAVGLDETTLTRDARVRPSRCRMVTATELEVVVRNHGAFDAERVAVVIYNGDPTRPVDPKATMESPAAELQTKQIGHGILRARGLRETTTTIRLVERPGPVAWAETYCLDVHDE
ncbi:MAG TPA: S8 family serine peptidase, partial [Armatimonadota bacterium]|nr:S8 family serine peptidase [Armatimonadota bacterium]